jgi:hypothetical protein
MYKLRQRLHDLRLVLLCPEEENDDKAGRSCMESVGLNNNRRKKQAYMFASLFSRISFSRITFFLPQSPLPYRHT